MQMRQVGALGAAAAVGLVGLAACGSSSKSSTASTGSGASGGDKATKIVIGSQNFPESTTLAYVYADALKDAGYTNVSVKPNLGSREVTAPALQAGQIDMIPEYLGNYLVFLNPSAGVLTVAQTFDALKPLAASKGLTVASYSQAADSDAIAVTQANADKYHLSSIADLSSVASQWTFGGPTECQTRVTCYAGLQQYYGLQFKAFKALDEDGPLTVSALQNGDVQAARIFSSDATIAADHFKVLADPKDFQGAGNITPVLRTAVATPGVLAVVNKVSAALTTDDLVSFNTKTGAPDHDDPQQVATDWVKSKSL